MSKVANSRLSKLFVVIMHQVKTINRLEVFATYDFKFFNFAFSFDKAPLKIHDFETLLTN